MNNEHIQSALQRVFSNPDALGPARPRRLPSWIAGSMLAAGLMSSCVDPPSTNELQDAGADTQDELNNASNVNNSSNINNVGNVNNLYKGPFSD